MKAFCPNCGGAVEFRFAQAIQTTCGYCRSILVRKDADIARVGQVADLPPTMSPIQIGTEGKHRGKAFTVAGRIIYDWEHGSWNEWHIVFQDGQSGWLSDAQAEYAVTKAAPFPSGGFGADQFFPGRKINMAGRDFSVGATTTARYRGVEGELPFEYWDKSEITFVDLRSTTSDFATIDFSESPPLLFLGESVEFQDLSLVNLKLDADDGPKRDAAALSCPNCGAGVELLAQGQTVTVTCGSCTSILDVTNPLVQIIQKQAAERVEPLIPLGSKAKFEGEIWQAIGFQVRRITVEGIGYDWREYVLFNLYRGFRYLTEYNGHWNDVKPVKHLPESTTEGGRPAERWMGRTYKHFQSATAQTVYVAGEFPWRVQVGETATANDFVSPPYLLSSEQTGNEVTWSHGEYIEGAEIWKRFGLQTLPPPVVGVYVNQPSPYSGEKTSVWVTYFLLAGLLLGSLIFSRMMMGNATVFEREYYFDPGTKSEASFVTPVFELKGRASNVEVEINSNLENNWLYFNLALVNEDTGQALDWGREVSYYSGRDSDGSWSEGGRNDRSRLGHVPAGRYYLRVEPDWEPPATTSAFSMQQTAARVIYTIRVRRDITILWPYLVALGILFIPAIVIFGRAFNFEASRWQESDYGSGSGGGSSDDDD